jgi:serine/threonine-protein phosphatase 2A regulatory subunit B''
VSKPKNLSPQQDGVAEPFPSFPSSSPGAAGSPRTARALSPPSSSPAVRGASSSSKDLTAPEFPPLSPLLSRPSSSSAGAKGSIPLFFTAGEGGRGRGRPIPEDKLETRLENIVSTWRSHWVEARRQAVPPAEAGKTAKQPVVQAPSTAGAPSETVVGVTLSQVDASLGLPVEQFAAVAKTLCGFPSFFAAPLFRRIRKVYGKSSKRPELSSESKEDESGSSPDDDSMDKDIPAQGYDEDTRGVVRLRTFLRFWRRFIEPYDHPGRFFHLVSQMEPLAAGKHAGRRAMVPTDFMPFLEELLAFHPGLAFLESTPEFQEKYARTVVARMMFELDPEGSGAITERALRRSDLLRAFHTVDMEEDINLVTRFFSYEHFYVLYCKFWELDSDHDFLLSREDLSKLPDLTHVVLDRVFQGAGRKISSGVPGKMGYEDFVCFFLAEEDKTSEVAIRFWFNVCDVDDDRVISPPDIMYFYRQQYVRMLEMGMEPVKFEDIVTQMTDLLKPDVPGHFQLKDFLNPTRVKLTGVFFSALFNLAKFQLFEGREATLVKQELNTQGITQWDRYASVEYMRLAEEEEEEEALGGGVLADSMIGGGGEQSWQE